MLEQRRAEKKHWNSETTIPVGFLPDPPETGIARPALSPEPVATFLEKAS
jgi:hypothetical protein